MNKFESVIIIANDLNDEERKNIIEDVKKIITDNKGEVTSVEEMGLKNLAYEIKKHKQAYYVILNYEIDKTVVPEIERYFRIKDEILKFITVNKED